MSQRISVLLVDHHVVVRRGIRRVLEGNQGFSVVGEADDGSQAINLACQLHPRVAIIECGLPRSDGFTVTRAILEPCPKTSVILLSTNSGTQWIRRAKEAGAQGFVPKQSTDSELVSVVRRVAAGEQVFLAEKSAVLKASSSRSLPKLTPRELEILQLIVEGNSTKDIAGQLRLSAHTVATHRARIGRSLGVRRTAELVAFAIRHGLIDDSS